MLVMTGSTITVKKNNTSALVVEGEDILELDSGKTKLLYLVLSLVCKRCLHAIIVPESLM